MCIIIDNETGQTATVETRDDIVQFMLVQTCRLMPVTLEVAKITTGHLIALKKNETLTLMNNRFTVTKQ